ncbi:MAG: type II toxin-antitoxin system VapC family toxin [Betaproteobacteria bacterium]|nr:type II toxin-antitoxin system VapC family toxin [Betaproteobacteria bacterium]
MKLLLDTHLLLWAAGEPRRLSRKARSLISDERNALAFSAASIWEVAIKSSLGRDDFQADAAQLLHGLLANGYEELPVRGRHAMQVAYLPMLHGDPFDRLLVAQARVEGLLLLTTDEQVAQYGIPIQRV